MMHLTKKVRINLLWVHEDYLKPAIYDLKYTLRTEVKNDSTREQLAEQQNISFVLLNFFINEYLHNTVIYETKQRAWLEKFMPEFNNTLTVKQLRILVENGFPGDSNCDPLFICNKQTNKKALTKNEIIEKLIGIMEIQQ